MWKRLFRLCIPLAANDALRSGLSTTEQMLIPRGLTRSGSTAEGALAAYGTIHGMVFPLIMFPSVLIYSLSDLLVPELAKCRAAKNHIRIRSLTDRCLRMGLVFASAFFGLCHSLSQPLGLTLYHSSEAAHYLRIFAPLIPILYMDAMVDGMHKGLGEQLYCVRINTATNLMDVILLGLLLPRWGITGYLFTFTLTHLLNFFLSLNHLINVTGYSPSVPFVGKVLCTTVGATCIATIWIRLLPSTATALVCGSMIYVAAFSLLLSVTASLTPEDCQWLRSVLPVRKAD